MKQKDDGDGRTPTGETEQPEWARRQLMGDVLVMDWLRCLGWGAILAWMKGHGGGEDETRLLEVVGAIERGYYEALYMDEGAERPFYEQVKEDMAEYLEVILRAAGQLPLFENDSILMINRGRV